jgi:ABC-type glycerol-3-phosphate transport system substrate-binding protein
MGRRLPRRTWFALATGAAVLLASAAAAMASRSSSVIVITCSACQNSPTDPFLQFNYKAVQQFNAKYKGTYQVKIVQNQYAGSGPSRLQYYQRLALANALPDLFLLQRSELQTLEATGKLYNFAPALRADKAWHGSFYPGSFASLTDAKGHIDAIPEERDSIGIFYNKSLFAKAGISSFPTTWSAFMQDCAKLKASGSICFAMDGNWVTLLMWANLIGTQPTGPQFLLTGTAKNGYASNAAVVKATEFLKQLHTSGFVNSDAFTGDYNNAATPFVQGQAAMIANGPWMVPSDIKGKNAIPNLYNQIGYAPSPGWTANANGLIVVAGNGGWVSGTHDKKKAQAVVAFAKFVSSPQLAFQQTLKTGAYPPVKLALKAAQLAKLEPLAYHLVQQSAKVKYTYTDAYFATPAAFFQEWTNDWPSYVQGAMSTTDFLNKLAAAATKTGP